LAVAVALAVMPVAAVAATAPGLSTPFVLQADDLTYDSDLGLVVASGHVEVWQGDYIMLSDSLSYNERTRIVAAKGNVSLLEPSGNVLFASYMELSDDLKNGVIRDVRLLLDKRARVAASGGRRIDGERNELDNVVYSPCDLCADDPTRPPLWQLKAVKVVHDEKEHTIEYRDAWLEIAGVPVFYTPYFSHPDPSVERKTGLLAPSLGTSKSLGLTARIPYFWSLGRDRSITFRPLVTTKQGVVLDAEYQQRVTDGEFNVRASATIADKTTRKSGLSVTDENQFRGHLAGMGRFDIDEHYRWGFDANLATDKTYLRLYDYSNERMLTSRLFLEGFHRRNFFSVQGLGFQGLRDNDDHSESPFILPKVDYSFVGEPDQYGGYYNFDTGLMALSRIDGRDSRRASVGAGWTLPYTAPAGDVYTFAASLRGDLYWYDDVDPNSDMVAPPAALAESGVAGRIFPQASLEWRYPFVRDHGDVSQVIEPIASVVISPNGMNTGKIPNEDSYGVEFDSTNLFSTNRWGGLDRVDSGQRLNYGLKWSLIGDDGGFTSVFLGQSYQLNNNNKFANGTGLEDNVTDMVGKVEISPNPYFDLLYRFRFDAGSLKVGHNEVGVVAGPPQLNLNASYFFLRGDTGAGAEFGTREQVTARLSSQFSDYWSAYADGRYDVDADRLLSFGGGIGYEDECFVVRTGAASTRYRDDEIRPDVRVTLEVAFKTLGDVQVGF
jgi:LPS-assembly protein